MDTSKNKNNSTNLVYIAGRGHSGSTLLNLILGNLENCWTAGELYQFLKWFNKDTFNTMNGRPCGCGKLVIKCDFWKSVKEKSEKNKGDINPIHSLKFLSKLKDFFIALFKLKKSKPKNNFCWDNEIVLNNIESEVKKKYNKDIDCIIDSSKGFRRAYALLKCPDINIRIIHLVKDPRSYVYSFVKRENNPIKSFLKVFSYSIKYILTNQAIWNISRKEKYKDKIKLIRYEDLASSSKSTTKEIANWLNIPYDENAVNNFRESSIHDISGNAMKNRSEKIYLDEKWKDNLNPFLKFITTILTYLPSKKYGYFQ